MATVINTTITERRGAKRIWVEGRKLFREGFLPSVKYNRTIEKGRITLVIHNEGLYTVSQRKRRNSESVDPVIDITNKEIAQKFGAIERVKIVIRRGIIVITPHSRDLKIIERVSRIKDKVAAGLPLSVTSLFHGGGVLDKSAHHGLKKAGLDSYVSMVVEIEDRYIESSLENNPELWRDDSIIVHSPIEDAMLKSEAFYSDIMIAALPCTGASKSGKAKNKLTHAEEHTAAGGMFYYFLRYIETVNPAIIQIENVKEYKSTAAMAAIRNVLENLGYKIQEQVFQGNDFGALEARERLCVVAISEGLDLDFKLQAVTASKEKPATLSAALEEISEDDERWKKYSYLADKQERDIKSGKGFKRQLLTGEEEKCGTIGRGYAKSRSTEPFIIHPADPSLSRLLTPKEHAFVKSIPYSIVNGLPDTIAHEILGQSVIYNLFFDIYKALGDSIKRLASTLSPSHLANAA